MVWRQCLENWWFIIEYKVHILKSIISAITSYFTLIMSYNVTSKYLCSIRESNGYLICEMLLWEGFLQTCTIPNAIKLPAADGNLY